MATARVHATAAASTIPLGAFAPVLPDPGRAAVPRGAFVRRAARSVAPEGDRAIVLVVDDAHLLDAASVALMAELVRTPRVGVLATVRADHDVPEELASIWSGGLADRIDIHSLARAEVEDLAVSALGGPVDGRLVERLWASSRGNPLYLRELLRGATATNDVIKDGGVWRLSGSLRTTPRLAELVEGRLRSVPESDLPLLEMIAFDEHLPSGTVVDRFGAEVLARLIRSGMVAAEMDDTAGPVRFAHPVYAQVLRASIATTRAKAVRRELADLIERSEVRRHGDALRLALLRLDADGAAPAAMLTDAAREAYFSADYPLAERLARSALEAGATWHTRRLLAEVLRWAGSFEQAEHELAAIDPGLPQDDGERVLLAVTRADNLFRGLNRREDAVAVLTSAGEAVSDEGCRAELAVRGGFFDIMAGDVIAGLDPVLAVASAEPSRASVTACLAGTFGLTASGRCEDAVDLAERGFDAASHLGAEFMVLPPAAQRFAQCLALVEAGRLVEAERTGRATYELVVAEGVVEGQASLAGVLGRVMLLRGRLSAAARLFREAALIWRDVHGPLQRWCWSGAVCASAAAGDVEAAAEAMRELSAVAPGAFTLFETDVERAGAWLAAAQGESSLAVPIVLAAAAMARQQELFAFEAGLLHDAVRFGAVRDVHERLAELTAIVQGPLVSMRAAHAAAVARGDGAALDLTSSSFEGIGADLFAAEAAAHASAAWRGAGRARLAAASADRALGLAARCENARLPALIGLDAGAGLTPREREIAHLASTGKSSREIAGLLSVSRRTVENHLQHAYEKLEVRNRTELAERLERAPPSPSSALD